MDTGIIPYSSAEANTAGDSNGQQANDGLVLYFSALSPNTILQKQPECEDDFKKENTNPTNNAITPKKLSSRRGLDARQFSMKVLKNIDRDSIDVTTLDENGLQEVFPDRTMRSQEQKVLLSFWSSCRGKAWRCREGWVRDDNDIMFKGHGTWTGITIDNFHDGAITKIELTDNNLQGKLLYRHQH